MRKPEVYVVITIDTEADHTVDWTKSDPLTFGSVTRAIPEKIEPIFKKYGAAGTYMLATEVLENEKALAVIRSLAGTYELGTHLHPEYIAPQKRYFHYAGTYSKEFSSSHSPSVEKEKLGAITDLFRQKIGYAPLVYRGGKFGFGDNTALSLTELGYLVDTSVTPRVSWRKIGGPDFRNCQPQPYFIKLRGDKKRLLEVPVSIGYLNIVDRLLVRPTWLRPSFTTAKKMKELIDNFMHRFGKENSVVLNMMFHSMEFYPGASPYSRNPGDCEKLLGRLEDTIRYCKNLGASFCRLSEIRKLYEDTSG